MSSYFGVRVGSFVRIDRNGKSFVAKTFVKRLQDRRRRLCSLELGQVSLPLTAIRLFCSTRRRAIFDTFPIILAGHQLNSVTTSSIYDSRSYLLTYTYSRLVASTRILVFSRLVALFFHPFIPRNRANPNLHLTIFLTKSVLSIHERVFHDPCLLCTLE